MAYMFGSDLYFQRYESLEHLAHGIVWVKTWLSLA